MQHSPVQDTLNSIFYTATRESEHTPKISEQPIRILLVDEDRTILSAFQRELEGKFDVVVVYAPEQALEKVTTDPTIKVVVSNSHFSRMNGFELIRKIEWQRVDILKILLVSSSESQEATKAKQDGHLFSFLTRPCAALELTNTITNAIASYEHKRKERDLIEKTLGGCVKILLDIIAVIDPIGSEETALARSLVRPMCEMLNIKKPWEVQLAVALYEVGVFTTPMPLLVRARKGESLTATERSLIDEIPFESARLLAQIHRLEGVAYLISQAAKDAVPPIEDQKESIEIIKLSREFAAHVLDTGSFYQAFEQVRINKSKYSSSVFSALELSLPPPEKSATKSQIIREITPEHLESGQKLASNVYTSDGVLLVTEGTVLTDPLVTRIHNYSNLMGLKGKIKVISK